MSNAKELGIPDVTVTPTGKELGLAGITIPKETVNPPKRARPRR
jgi:hypothetical protein